MSPQLHNIIMRPFITITRPIWKDGHRDEVKGLNKNIKRPIDRLLIDEAKHRALKASGQFMEEGRIDTVIESTSYNIRWN